MNKDLSDKIRIASLLCTLMVIMRHSRNLQAFWGTENVTNTCAFIENGFSTLTEIAVPYFFLVSGFFFFRSDYYDRAIYSNMLKKKCKTLLIPFLIWNLIGFSILWLAGERVNDNPTAINNFGDFIIGLLLSNYDGPLWYVRNLIMMMLSVPLYGWIVRLNSAVLYCVVGIGLFLWWWPVDCAWYSSEGCLFFFLGGVVKQNAPLLEKRLQLTPLVIFTCLWIACCFLHPFWGLWMNKLTTLVGIVCFWGWLPYLLNCRIKEKMLNMCSYAFFIYVIHIFVIKTMKLLLAHTWPRDEVIALSSYFCLTIVTFFLLYWTGMLWNRLFPQSFRVCMGGRT